MKGKLNDWFERSICLTAFAICVFPKALPALILLAGILWIAAIPAKEKWNSLKKNKYHFLACTGLFWVYLLSMLYTENIPHGWTKIETSLSLLIFPLICYTSFSNQERITGRVIRWFIYGCIAGTAICLGYALFCYCFPQVAIANQWSEWDYKLYFFWKDRLSPFLHTTYISMYLAASIAFLIFGTAAPAFNKKISLLLIFLFSVMILLLSSRAGLITLGLLWGIFISKTVITEKAYLKAALILSLVISIFTALFLKSEQFNLRVSSMFSVFLKPGQQDMNMEKSLIRFKIWPAAFETGVRHLPLGTGIGDASDVLDNTFIENGMALTMEKSLNAHNQFLQTFIASGIPGMLALVILLAVPITLSLRNKNRAYLTFLSIVIINFLFESMLQTQAGVIFFAFINSILFCTFLKK